MQYTDQGLRTEDEALSKGVSRRQRAENRLQQRKAQDRGGHIGDPHGGKGGHEHVGDEHVARLGTDPAKNPGGHPLGYEVLGEGAGYCKATQEQHDGLRAEQNRALIRRIPILYTASCWLE